MKIKGIFLEGPRHLKRPKVSGRSLVPSDTIFSAICCSLRRLDYDVDDFIEKFSEKGCRIGSMFPRGPREVFFPVPLYLSYSLWEIASKNSTQIDREFYRKIKKIKKGRYVKKTLFEKILGGETLSILELEEGILSPESFKEIPRAALDRVTEESSLYYLGEGFLPGSINSWIPYLGDEKVLEEYIMPALRELGDRGIGGKSTWGMGGFKVSEVKDLEIKTPESAYGVTLSLTLVTKEAGSMAKFWDLIEKGGWTYPFAGKSLRKPSYVFFLEGSVFDVRYAGKIISLDCGDISVKIYGKSLLLPASLPEVIEG